MKFYVAWWMYVFIAINLMIACFFAGLFFLFPESGIGPFSEFTFLALAFLLLAFAGLWKFVTAELRIQGDELRLKSGFKTRLVALKGVRNLYVKGFFIILDEGSIPRFVIPRIFAKETIIVREISQKIGRT
jgi:hypothetical protein